MKNISNSNLIEHIPSKLVDSRCRLINDTSTLISVISIMELENYELLKPRHELIVEKILNRIFSDIESCELELRCAMIIYYRPIILTLYRRTVKLKINVMNLPLKRRKMAILNRVLKCMFEQLNQVIKIMEFYESQDNC